MKLPNSTNKQTEPPNRTTKPHKTANGGKKGGKTTTPPTAVKISFKTDLQATKPRNKQPEPTEKTKI